MIVELVILDKFWLAGWVDGCWLDYCNALLFGISGGLTQRLQSVGLLQNAAARLVTGASRREHITPVLRVLRQLQWLPVKQRIDFKLAVLVYKSLHGLAPPYMSDDCKLVTARRGKSTSQVFRRLHACRPADTVTDWRQEFLCSRTAAMEQPTDRDPEERHYVRTL